MSSKEEVSFSEFYYSDEIVTENEGNVDVFLSATSAEAADVMGENQETIIIINNLITLFAQALL